MEIFEDSRVVSRADLAAWLRQLAGQLESDGKVLFGAAGSVTVGDSVRCELEIESSGSETSIEIEFSWTGAAAGEDAEEDEEGEEAEEAEGEEGEEPEAEPEEEPAAPPTAVGIASAPPAYVSSFAPSTPEPQTFAPQTFASQAVTPETVTPETVTPETVTPETVAPAEDGTDGDTRTSSTPH